MHESVLTWGRAKLASIAPVGRVLEIGSHNVNGSLRYSVEGCTSYTGIDTVAGPGVDIVMDGLDAPRLGSFDVVIMTEVLEHAEHWEALLMAAQACVRPGGHLLITTRSPGYKWHGTVYRNRANPGWAPETWHIGDHWRFTVAGLRAALAPPAGLAPPAFGGWSEIVPDPDPDRPGVFAFVRRNRWPAPFYSATPMEQPEPAHA